MRWKFTAKGVVVWQNDMPLFNRRSSRIHFTFLDFISSFFSYFMTTMIKQVTVSSPLAVSSIIDVDNEAANGIVHVVDAVF